MGGRNGESFERVADRGSSLTINFRVKNELI